MINTDGKPVRERLLVTPLVTPAGWPACLHAAGVESGPGVVTARPPAGEQKQLVTQCAPEEIPATKQGGSINWQFKALFYQHPYIAHLLLRVRSNIQYGERGDYPAAYNKPLFAFEEPDFCRPFPNISGTLPGELTRASQGHWLLILWGLSLSMRRRVWMEYNWEQ